MKYIYGPVPSRRMGMSLGISPIPPKTCNYSCIYCQLGRTDHMTNTREMFYPVEDILAELDDILKKEIPFDVVTIVGEGEPTLYLGLGELIRGIRERVTQPVAVITNGALLYDPDVREELMAADIVLPTVEAIDEVTFRQINRPHGALEQLEILKGLRLFAEEYPNQLWLELMLMQGINDDQASLIRYRNVLKTLRYDRLYLNTPVRPPAEAEVKPVDAATMARANSVLGGTSIDFLVSEGFSSDISDDREAIVSIIGRHPMNQYEIEHFLSDRGVIDPGKLLLQLEEDARIERVHYKGYDTFRLKTGRKR